MVDEDICRYGALNLRITDYNIVKLQMTSCFSKGLISSLACFRGVWRARTATHTIMPPIAPSCCWQDQRAMLTHTDLIHSCCWSDSVRRRLLIPPTNTNSSEACVLLPGTWRLCSCKAHSEVHVLLFLSPSRVYLSATCVVNRIYTFSQTLAATYADLSTLF